METVVVIIQSDWESARGALLTPDGCENAGVLFCGTASSRAQRKLLVRSFRPVPPEFYLERESYHLEIAPAFYNRLVSDCLRDRLTPIIIHSHPFHGRASYSSSDDYGEGRLLETLNSLLPKTRPASLVISYTSVAGRELDNGEFRSLTGLRIIGSRVTKASFNDTLAGNKSTSERFDRQIRAFGAEGQATLSSLRTAVIGLGGIGSLVAEQLIRIGVGDVILVDYDRVEESNVSRLFGARTSDVGRHKADVLARYLNRIGDSKISAITESAIRQSVLLQLRDRDLIFACVDNDQTRAVLNRFAHQYLIPVIDHGTRLDARAGKVTAAAGRVSIVGPEFTCLRCSHHINPERIRAESMPSEERIKLQREGYIMGIDDPAPAVVSINTVVAGLGVTAGINLFVGLTGQVQPAGQIYDATSGAVFPVHPTHESGCDVCDASGVKGLGDLQIVSAYE